MDECGNLPYYDGWLNSFGVTNCALKCIALHPYHRIKGKNIVDV